MVGPDAGLRFDRGTARTYPLSAPHELNSTCPLGAIPLAHADRPALESLAVPGQDDTYTEALLIPTDAGRTISVLVGDTVVGVLPDTGAVTDSQIARIYASGHLPSCTLHITPGGSHLARILLVSPEMCLPHNSPPTKDWTLLPDGIFWQVEPTRLSPFQMIPEESQMLLELRTNGDLIYTYLNGTECGILDLAAAEALCGGVAHAQHFGLVPVVRGFLRVSPDRKEISLQITALPFADWTKTQRRLSRNPLPRLIPYSTDTRDYRSGLHCFLEEHPDSEEPVRPGVPLRAAAPMLSLGFGVLTIAVGLILSGVHSGAAFGVISLGVAIAALGIWACICRRRDTADHTQPRHWGVVAPLAVGIMIPAISFTVVGMIMDARGNLNESLSSELITMPSAPFEAIIAEPPAESGPFTPDTVTAFLRSLPAQSPASLFSTVLSPSFSPLPPAPESSPEPPASPASRSARPTTVNERTTSTTSRPAPPVVADPPRDTSRPPSPSETPVEENLSPTEGPAPPRVFIPPDPQERPAEPEESTPSPWNSLDPTTSESTSSEPEVPVEPEE